MTTRGKSLVDSEQVRQAYSILTAPNQVVEVRALEASKDRNPRYLGTLAGYFDNARDLLREISQIQTAMGIYMTLQPCHPDLLHRAANKLIAPRKGQITADKDITHYCWLALDSDPDRVAGISSTDEEHDQALAHSRRIREELTRLGWPQPLFADSGNGAHLLYKIDLPVSESDLVKRVLAGLASRFDELGIHVDQTLFNQSRIIKLYGTLACKGDDTPRRPHRLSRLLEAPQDIQVVSRDLLEAIAAPGQTVQTQQPVQISQILPGAQEGFTAEHFLHKHHISIKSSGPYQGGTRYVLEACAWDSSHTDNSACVYQFADGRLGASCSHNSCSGKGWRDFRLVFEPDAYTPKHITRPNANTIDNLIYGEQGEKGKQQKKGSVDPHFILECLEQGEYGDSLLFTHLFKGLTLYDHTAQEWYVWGGHHWEPDDTGKIKHLISGKLASEYLKAGATLNLQASQAVAKAELSDNEEEKAQAKEQVSRVKGIVKQLNERAFSLRQVSRCRNIQYFACSHKGMGIRGNQWDRNTWLLGVPNGVIDLRVGECRPGNPEDYIRTVSPTEWKGLHVVAPRWERFLQEIFEDRTPEERAILIQFLQRLLGYGITGEVREHVFTVLYGEDGRNGKDTLQLALTKTLGPASGAIQKDVLLETGKGHSAGAPTPHLSDLQGRRLAWASEPEKGARFNVGQIKELSGGGEIPTRGLHEKKITKIKPSHLLLLLTNHKPHASADDSAFWSRLIMITFNMRFVDDPLEPNERKKDTSLWEILEAEAPGILAWLVRGCLEWQQQGLAIPECVKADGQKYRDEEDQVRLFLQECCVVKPECEVKASTLYAAYEAWAKAGNLYMMNKMLFGLALGKKMFKKDTTRYGVFYRGLGLVDHEYEDDSVNTSGKYSQVSKPATQAGVGGIANEYREHCEHLIGVFPKNGSREGQKMEKPRLSVHSVHSPSREAGVTPPVEPIEEGVNTSTQVFTDIHNNPSGPEKENAPSSSTTPAPRMKRYRITEDNPSPYRDQVEQVRTLAKQGGRQKIYWSVPSYAFASEEVSVDDYCARLLTCLNSSEPNMAVQELEWQLKRLASAAGGYVEEI